MIKAQQRPIDSILLFVIILVAGVLRFWNFSEMPYMHDELSALARTNFSSFSEMIAKGARVDGHPVGVQVFLCFWVKAFGTNEMFVKFPFIICGLLSIFYVFKIGKFWFNSSVALIVSAFMAATQYFIMYSQIARPYISGLFFSLIMVWSWSNFLFAEEKKNKWLIGYILSAVLCAYDHHFALLFAVIVGFTGLFFLSKYNWKKYIFAAIAIFVLYIPHLQIFFYQLNKGGVGGEGGWLSKPSPDWLYTFIKYTFHFSYAMYFVVLALLIYGIVKSSSAIKSQQKFRVVALLWFLLMYAIGYFYSIKINPVLQYSTLIFVFPFFLLFLFSLTEEMNNKLKTLVISAVLVIGIFSLVFTRKHFQIFYKQPYQQEITNTFKVLDEIGNEKNATIELMIPPYFKEHYFKKYNRKFDFVFFNSFDENPDNKAFRAFVNKQQTNYFVAGNLPLEYLKIIKEKYPYVFKKEEGFTYSFYCFAKEKPTKEIFENTIFEKTNPAITIDSTQEYGPAFSKKLLKIVKSSYSIVNVSAEISAKDSSVNPVLVMSIQDGNESLSWRGSEYKWFASATDSTCKIYVSQLLAGLDLQKHPKAEIKIYVWNRDKKNINVSPIKIEATTSSPFIYGLYEPLE